MAGKEIMVDTNILIDYFRKTNKQNARLLQHFVEYDTIYISSITEFEIISGSTDAQLQFWDLMLARLKVLDFDVRVARKAADIVKQLKKKRKSIDKADLFIAATALVHKLTLDTENRKHFALIETLQLLPK